MSWHGLLFVLAGLGLLLSGCCAVAVGTAGGAGTYVYLKGQLVREYNAGLDRSFEAALAACQALDLKVEDRAHNLSEAAITALDGERTVHIGLESISTRRTELRVRVGFLGDKIASKRIHNEFERQLKGLT